MSHHAHSGASPAPGASPATTKNSGHTLTPDTRLLPRVPPRSAAWVGGSMSSGLSAVLETAALMHASGQSDAARSVLEEAISSEPDTAKIPLVWLALLDIYQQTGDKEAFERWGMEYAVRFEQSPPVWVARNIDKDDQKAHGKKKNETFPIVLQGDISGDASAIVAQLQSIVSTVSPDTIYRLDLRQTALVDDTGAAVLAQELARARRKLQKTIISPWPEKLVASLKHKIKHSAEKEGQGYWLLLLELLQWRGEESVFERCAFDFAVRFEVSPPSWSPVQPEMLEKQRNETLQTEDAISQSPSPNVFVWSGVLQGNRSPKLEAFKQFVATHDMIIVDMHDVLRVDFSFGGALVNQVSRAESAKKSVRFIRTSPIVLSLLLLVGLPSRMFSRHR
jgi:anti-anti-sigma regulatory factor